jgi:CPA2 family monovalent cation:H+ antiporter-2
MLTDLAVILGVALFAGLVARRFRQSALLAYLVGGIIIGPHGLKIIEGGRELQALAEIGVALLMFTLGVEFSLRGLSNVRDFAIYGGVLQVMLTTVLGFVLGRLLGFSVIQSAYLGCVIAISSTVIVLRTLQERGEQETPHGRALIGILIVQDLAVVAMMGILPLLSNFTLSRLPELGASLLKAASYLILVLVLAKSWIPWVLRKVAASGSKELFALTILAVIFAAALGTQAIGFSLAIGAFIAGLIVSESEFSHEVLAEVAPLRDVFAIVFFVSLGMLVNLQLFVRYLVPIIACVVLIIIGKLLVGGGVALGFGYRMRSALLIGLGLTQVGEFSFVIAQDGLARGAVDLKFYSVILSSALITIVLTTALLAIGNGLYNQMIKVVDLDRFFGWRAEPRSLSERIELSDHVILLG